MRQLIQMAFGLGAICVSCVVASAASPDLQKDWPWWRGPNSNGIAAGNQSPPTEFGPTRNVIWRIKVPGRGHASPVIVGDRIFLTTADERARVQGAICYDKNTGKQVWITPIHKGGLPGTIHPKNTHASGTVTCDGENIYTVFYNNASIMVSSLTVGGKLNWSKRAGAFNPKKYQFGYGASPLLYKDKVIVAGESDSGSFLVAFDTSNGSVAWRAKRRSDISFSTPIVANVAGKEQLLLSGLFEVSSFDPASGQKLWSVPGTTQATCGTMVWDGDMVYASGGYPDPQTVAVNAKTGQVAWTNNQKCYEQSMLAHDGALYGVTDKGVAYCWDGKTGREMWKTRLGGLYSASPILVGENIFVSNEAGTVFVFKATSESFQKVAQNQLGDEAFATPAFIDNKIYARVAAKEGGIRQEYLYCIGEK